MSPWWDGSPVTEAQVHEFRAALSMAAGDPARRHKITVLPPGQPALVPAGPLDAVSDLCLTPPEASVAEPLPACRCGSADQVTWAHAFGAHLCFSCRTQRTWELLDGPPGGGPPPAACRCDWPPGNPLAVHRPWCDAGPVYLGGGRAY